MSPYGGEVSPRNTGFVIVSLHLWTIRGRGLGPTVVQAFPMPQQRADLTFAEVLAPVLARFFEPIG